MNAPTIVKKPLVIIFEAPDGEMMTHIWPSAKADSHAAYGLIVCDLVRHVAVYFKVDEVDVWEWVEKERFRPTTEFGRLS